MNRWSAIYRPFLLATFLVLVASCPASAQVHLSYTPADTTIAPGGQGRLSILIADSLEIRTIDVTVTYDTTIVRSVGGAAGKLYTDSGVFTFQGFEEDTLGTWHGYAVLMGAGLFVMGPGELYTWDFEGLSAGMTPITTVSVFVATTDGSWFENVTLPGTTITVHDPLSSVGDLPVSGHTLNLQPNPFNPRTEVRFELEHDSWTRLAVFDMRGRQIAILQEGMSYAGPVVCAWDGRDASGQDVPSGVYFFMLESDKVLARTKGVLLK